MRARGAKTRKETRLAGRVGLNWRGIRTGWVGEVVVWVDEEHYDFLVEGGQAISVDGRDLINDLDRIRIPGIEMCAVGALSNRSAGDAAQREGHFPSREFAQG
jgi:hypothetical protein